MKTKEATRVIKWEERKLLEPRFLIIFDETATPYGRSWSLDQRSIVSWVQGFDKGRSTNVHMARWCFFSPMRIIPSAVIIHEGSDPMTTIAGFARGGGKRQASSLSSEPGLGRGVAQVRGICSWTEKGSMNCTMFH